MARYETETLADLAETINEARGLIDETETSLAMIADSLVSIMENDDDGKLAHAAIDEQIRQLSTVSDRLFGAAEKVETVDGELEDANMRVVEAENETETMARYLKDLAPPTFARVMLHELTGREGEDGAAGALNWVKAALGRLAAEDLEVSDHGVNVYYGRETSTIRMVV